MNTDSAVIIIAVLAAIAALAVAARLLAKYADKQRARKQAEAEQAAKKAAEEEKRQRELWKKKEAERREHESRVESAHERMIIARQQHERAQESFRDMHDELVEAVREQARLGCDAAFRQRFGVARPPRGASFQDDPEAQDYLREHYAELRDAAIAELTERIVQEETDRRLSVALARQEAEMAQTAEGELETPDDEATATAQDEALVSHDEDAEEEEQATQGERAAEAPDGTAEQESDALSATPTESRPPSEDASIGTEGRRALADAAPEDTALRLTSIDTLDQVETATASENDSGAATLVGKEEAASAEAVAPISGQNGNELEEIADAGGVGAQSQPKVDAATPEGLDVFNPKPSATAPASADATSREGADTQTATEDGPVASEEADTPSPAMEDEPEADEQPTAPCNPTANRETIEADVREYLDADSLRTYMLAAISARYNSSGAPANDLPWPAYTEISSLGYGELALVDGAPATAQEQYCQMAWRKFHIGRRAEKPRRGEYSWPESHELGDSAAEPIIETPAGGFSATAGGETLAMREINPCAWVRRDMVSDAALLRPDSQRCLLLNLEGMRKGTRIDFRFDRSEPFLQEAPEGAFTLNAVGNVGDAWLGVSVSKPEVASPGEAPYEIVGRDGLGFAFRLTSDARRHDDDMYPQFIQVNLTWCAPPSLEPEAVVRHLTQ